MRLWTMQSPALVETLLRDGIVFADPSLVFTHGDDIDIAFRTAYEYMVSTMRHRLPTSPHTYPMWAWVRPPFRRKDGGPDMRSYRNYERTLIELDVDESRVLISDHETWHYVLNNWTVQLYEDEFVEKHASWSRIFDVTPDGRRINPCDPDWLSASDLDIQACVWEIRTQDVVSIRHYKERK